MISYNNITIGSFIIIIIVMALHWYDSRKIENNNENIKESLVKKFGKETHYDSETSSYIWLNINPFDQIRYVKNEKMIYLFVPSINVDIINNDNVKYDQNSGLLMVIDKTWNNVLARLYLTLYKITDTTVFNDTVESLNDPEFEEKLLVDINTKLTQLNGEKQKVPPRQEPNLTQGVGAVGKENFNGVSFNDITLNNRDKLTQLDKNWAGEVGIEQVSLDNLYTFN